MWRARELGSEDQDADGTSLTKTHFSQNQGEVGHPQLFTDEEWVSPSQAFVRTKLSRALEQEDVPARQGRNTHITGT
jgi:hypothetical protein